MRVVISYEYDVSIQLLLRFYLLVGLNRASDTPVSIQLLLRFYKSTVCSDVKDISSFNTTLVKVL